MKTATTIFILFMVLDIEGLISDISLWMSEFTVEIFCIALMTIMAYRLKGFFKPKTKSP